MQFFELMTRDPVIDGSVAQPTETYTRLVAVAIRFAEGDQSPPCSTWTGVGFVLRIDPFPT